MIKHALQYLRFLLPWVFINKKKRNYENLERSFGQVKDETFDFELIEKYFKSNKHNNLQEVISDKTCNDLDLDDHFKFIDRTNSKVGQQYLYNQIRSGCYDEARTALNENSNVGFDYKLKPGKLKTRNAIKILEINEYPSEIVQEANTIAKKLDQTQPPNPKL